MQDSAGLSKGDAKHGLFQALVIPAAPVIFNTLGLTIWLGYRMVRSRYSCICLTSSCLTIVIPYAVQRKVEGLSKLNGAAARGPGDVVEGLVEAEAENDALKVGRPLHSRQRFVKAVPKGDLRIVSSSRHEKRLRESFLGTYPLAACSLSGVTVE